MYNDPGAGLVLGGGAGTAGALAVTGLNVMALAVLAFALLLVGLVLVRSRSVRLELDGPAGSAAGGPDGTEPSP